MKRRLLVVASALALALLLVYTAFGRASNLLPIIRSATAMTIKEDDFEGHLYEKKISSPKAVQQIVGAVQLSSAPRCACDHGDTIVFKTPKGQVDASYCDHCFDVKYKNQSMHCQMPPELLQAIVKALDGDPQKWRIRESIKDERSDE